MQCEIRIERLGTQSISLDGRTPSIVQIAVIPKQLVYLPTDTILASVNIQMFRSDEKKMNMEADDSQRLKVDAHKNVKKRMISKLDEVGK